jgi:CBS domain-containing protein
MFDPRKLTAADIMTADVMTVKEDAPISEAVSIIEDYGVSGVPVVNAVDECVGVFTLADLARRETETEEGEAPRAAGYFNFDPLGESLYLDKDEYDEEAFERETVGEWMARDLKKVRPETSVSEVCRIMLREGVHRVVVMEGKALRGIVSSLDVVALLAGPAGARPRSRAKATERVRAPRAKAGPKARTRRQGTKVRTSRAR